MTDTMQKGRKIGQYEVVGPLGKGGMATVYRAYQPALDREVAIKIIAEQFATDVTFVERFRREARAVARLRHPNILAIYDFGEENQLFYLVMELIDGPTLKDQMHGQPMPVDKALDYIKQIASALDYANKNGIIHRDVKPSNVLLDNSGRAVLSDFGIAKMAASNTQLTNTGTGIGTPDYMSPEQAMGEELDARSDQYSLGVMLYELLTGRTPFTGDTPIAVVMGHVSKPLPPANLINPQIPLSVEKVLEKALSKKAVDRYESTAGFGQALEDAWRNRNNAELNVGNSPASASNQAGQDQTTAVAVPTVPRPGSGPYIPEAEQLYSKARSQEALNNFHGAFSTFHQLNGQFPKYRDVPTILDRYLTMGYGQPQPTGWQTATGHPGISGQYTPPGQFQSQPYNGYYGTPAPVAKKAGLSPAVLLGVGLIVLVALGIIALLLASGSKKSNQASPVAVDTATGADQTTTTPEATSAEVTTTPPNTTVALIVPPPSIKIDTPVPAVTPNAADTGKGKYVTFKEPDGVWNVEIPDAWVADPQSLQVTFSPKDDTGSGIVVVSQDLGSLGDLPPDSLSSLIKSFLEPYGAKIDKDEKRKVDGQDANLSTGTFTQSGVTYNMKLISFIKNKKLFLVMFISAPGVGTDFDQVLTHFLDTFKVA